MTYSKAMFLILAAISSYSLMIWSIMTNNRSLHSFVMFNFFVTMCIVAVILVSLQKKAKS